MAETNFGTHLSTVFKDGDTMKQVGFRPNIKKVDPKISTFDSYFSFMLSQAIESYVGHFGILVGKGHQVLVPNQSMDLFYLGLQAFDYMPSGKNGCRGTVKQIMFKT